MKVSIFDLSASFVPNLAPALPSFVRLYQRLALPFVLCLSDANPVKADNCNALGLIMQITGALVKFLICQSLLLSLDEEVADLSLSLAFSPYP